MRKWGLGAGVGLVLATAGTAALADVNVNLEEVASGLTAPMMMVQPPGDDRKFIAEQVGVIKILTADGQVLSQPFLDIRHKTHPSWRCSTSAGCSAWRSTPTTPTMGSSTSPTAPTSTGVAIPASSCGGLTPT